MLPTCKFQHALPYVALRVSPSLAALYTSRAQSPGHSDSCSKCGSYLLHGNATIRVIRLKRSRKLPIARALRRTCHACGYTNELRIDTDSIPPIHDNHPPPIAHEPTSPVPPPTQAKHRPKKKTGLQEMLSRSREKVKEEKSHDDQVGLAAFLSTL